MSPAAQQRAAEKARLLDLEMDLTELRQAFEISQVELAKKLGIGQAAVAKIEQRTDMYLSTLSRVITALGGHLRITADFGGLPISIKGFSSNSVVLDKIGAKEFRPFLKRAGFRFEKMNGLM